MLFVVVGEPMRRLGAVEVRIDIAEEDRAVVIPERFAHEQRSSPAGCVASRYVTCRTLVSTEWLRFDRSGFGGSAASVGDSPTARKNARHAERYIAVWPRR